MNMRRSRYEREKSERREPQPRKAGYLHPHTYQFIIQRDFDGGLRDIPDRLYWCWKRSQKAWEHKCEAYLADFYPHDREREV